MNSNGNPLIGIAYNLYVPIARHIHEQVSEETVEEMAQQAYEAVLSLDYPAILSAHGLPTAKARLIEAADQAVGLRFPLIVKPNAEDASQGVYPNSVVH